MQCPVLHIYIYICIYTGCDVIGDNLNKSNIASKLRKISKI